ncbi:Mitotic spindle assembly checkpoint protein MAD2B [Takifugu flavidus]|uniref:Mitotic spindle assembly checkpoint protein MAD2B n=1 Tax=Takifugu flavidus TaxID=433684 RepID=A0A5C6MLY0_9TELE|nr:Mitotic spindle assembly checkpoint protein MAD2B [Takifugu flavidus]
MTTLTRQDLNFGQVVADILCEFLEVAIHLILYVREVYPSGIFQKRKKYNVPVQMSCHPELNQYIQDTLHCMKPLIEKNDAEKVVVVIMDKEHRPVERFVFEISQPTLLSISSDSLLSHVEQLLRAFILKISVCDAVLNNNPPGCSFSVLVHTREAATRSMEKVQVIKDFPWIVADEQEVHMKEPRLIPLKTMTSDIVKEFRKCLQQLLVQSQFSLGCALSCSLHFLHEGAIHRWLCLILAAALSWFLARKARLLLRHVMALFELHSSQRYCGICISLLTSGHCLLPMLYKAMTIAFSVAVVASVSIINRHFLSATEALRFWTPLTICYTLLVVYMQEEQHRLPSGQAVLNTVVVRLGGLTVLMLTVGRWADVLHILICFLGEASCLLPTMDLLDAASSQDEEDYTQYTREHGRRPLKQKTQNLR